MVFHFNKKHLEDTTVPMWVVKTKGETYYVEHVDCKIGWSTKETPDNSHTKGSIKIKNCLLVIDDENCANITQLTEHDKVRLRNRDRGITRIITKWGQSLNNILKLNNIKHGPVKTVGGGCGTRWFITDILKKSHLSMLTLTDLDFRVLMENEPYYKYYDDPNCEVKYDEDHPEYYYEDDDED